MNKHWIILFYLFFLYACTSHSKKENKTNLSLSDSIDIIIDRKNEIDSMIHKMYENKNYILYITFDKDDIPRKIDISIEIDTSNDVDYENAYYFYSIYKNKSQKIIAISESPNTSGHGDFGIEAIHYFDTLGKTFAFQKQLSTFQYDSETCGEGPIYTSTINYFINGKLVKENYEIWNNKKEKPKEGCNYNDPIQISIYSTLKEYLSSKKIEVNINE